LVSNNQSISRSVTQHSSQLILFFIPYARDDLEISLQNLNLPNSTKLNLWRSALVNELAIYWFLRYEETIGTKKPINCKFVYSTLSSVILTPSLRTNVVQVIFDWLEQTRFFCGKFVIYLFAAMLLRISLYITPLYIVFGPNMLVCLLREQQVSVNLFGQLSVCWCPLHSSIYFLLCLYILFACRFTTVHWLQMITWRISLGDHFQPIKSRKFARDHRLTNEELENIWQKIHIEFSFPTVWDFL